MADTVNSTDVILHVSSPSPKNVKDSNDAAVMPSTLKENDTPSKGKRGTVEDTSPEPKGDGLDMTSSSDNDDEISIDVSTGEFGMHQHLGFISSVSMCVGTIVGE